MIPIKLTLENFVSHIYSVIDFTEFNSALIVGSFENNPDISNGSGKSALLEGVRFALFGMCKYSIKSKVVKRGKVSCKVEFLFSMNDEEYKINRTLSVKTGIITLDFAKKVGEEYESEGYTCDTTSATNKKIVEVLGMNDDTFVNIVYFRQNDLSGFAYARVGQRKEILKEALQIGIWDEFQKISKSAEKVLEERKKILDERVVLLKDIEHNAVINVENMNKNKEQVANVRKDIKVLEGCVGATIDKNQLVFDLQKIDQRITEIVEQRDALRESFKRNNNELVMAHNECNMLDDRIVAYCLDALKIPYENRNKIETLYKLKTGLVPPHWVCDVESLEKKNISKNEIDRKISQYKIDLTRLLFLEPGKECPVCLTKIDNPSSVEKRRFIKRKFLENSIQEEIIKSCEIKKEIDKEEDIIKKARIAFIEIERTELIIAKRMARISELVKNNENSQKNFAIIAQEWENLNNKKILIRQQIDEVCDKSSNLPELREELIRLSIIQGNLKSEEENLERKKSEKDIIEQEINIISSDMAIYSKLTKAFGKDGIQAIILENITEDLRQFTNSILRNIYHKPISIDFITQRQTTSGSWKEDFDIVIDMDGEKFDFEDISGGEQVRVSIAIRLALSQLLMRRVGSNIKFLLFDEVDQALDRHGLEALAETINKLSNEFKILVITHNEYMKEKFENVITVHMGPSGSVLR